MPLNGTERIDPAAIVRLSHAQSHLYAEVIQVMAERQMGWLRPLLLAEAEDESGAESPVPVKIHDLRQGADLLWPLDLLEPALDTEVLPLFSQPPPHRSAPSEWGRNWGRNCCSVPPTVTSVYAAALAGKSRSISVAAARAQSG